MTKYFTEHKAWLRAALASHTAYLLGKMPKYKHGLKMDVDIMNSAVDDCRKILEAEITELTK